MIAQLFEIAARCRVPTLVFDLPLIERRLRELRALGRRYGCDFLMAVKSCPEPAVLEIAARQLSGFDVSNARERAMLPSGSRGGGALWLTGPALESGMLRRGSRRARRELVTIETPERAREMERLGREYAVRLDASELLGQKRRPSRFGASITELDVLRELVSRAGFAGFHLHHGFQDTSAADFARLARGALRLAEKLGCELRVLNLGGGLGTVGFEGLGSMLAQVRKTLPPATKLCFEPGRLLTEHAGFAAGRVLSNSRAGRGHRCVLSVSRLCHLQWSEPKMVFAAPSRPAQATAFFGPTCSELDVFGELRAPALREGAPVLFSNVSGYSLAWNHGFNGIAPAKKLFLSSLGLS